ncbi:cobalt transporter CbiM [Desulfofustis glycolicus]|jgi:cobalt/nickel transport system permease protein|uniref:Cobalt/nickel transport system permease protein n=1 Tax=Desulfofustis glycolicus DSM 9705 TaxID=1121409 RepID=A0A1M5XZY0_9BACT|nr:cobalt transporter CbiM [Desulfofustis glycolicus]MCB2218248.1 cobalt transporter CbiM [Desulfobulbaceae bacterium]MEE4315062.1 cobalt transporter CbiM [Desulfofustis sp.]SHI05249.1 cobalt/nickel transport system permease protein [Desulfofustis glycolicus DSM 9705]
MHISEGVLSAPVLIGGGVLTVIGTGIGLHRLDYDRIMNTAILTSAFFVASLVHVPIGPGSIHLVLNGLLGIILGWACFPAILVALLLQAVFFQFGGLLVLGVNTFNMAAPALLCYYLVRPLLARPKTRGVAGFAGGALAIFLAALCMALSLALSDSGFLATAKLVVIANLPIMLIEGIVTMFAITFLAKVTPDLITGSRP